MTEPVGNLEIPSKESCTCPYGSDIDPYTGRPLDECPRLFECMEEAQSGRSK